MSDPTDLATIGTHTGVGALAAAITTGIARFFAGKEATEVATRLALLESKIDTIVKGSEKHDGMSERLALLEAKVNALHDRLDGRKPRR